MAATNSLRDGIRARPVAVTAVLSVIGYALVLGTFGGWLEIYPTLSEAEVKLLAHLIAVINTLALTALLVGVYYVTNSQYRKHRAAMLVAFSLILLFLVVYLTKVGGGFEREIVGAPTGIYEAYLGMLGIHVVLSIISVPVVLYVILLGVTHSFSELQGTNKARVGRIAAGAWILSLTLGIITYIMLNHIYGAEPREPRGAWLLVLTGAQSVRTMFA
jgi:putative membrane protein